jgi:hypothetical protein
VSVWSILQAQAASKAQSREQARQATLAEAQTVQFIGGEVKPSSGGSDIDAIIENFNKLPLIYDEIRWPGGPNTQYASIGSCEQIYLSAPAAGYSEPFKYVLGAILYYRTPSGVDWARRLNGLPYRVKRLPVYSYTESTSTAIPDCSPE